MKNLIRLLIVISFVFSFGGCSLYDEQLKKDIVGTYSYSVTETVDEQFLTVESKVSYKNGILKENAVLTITIFDENIGKITLKYKASVEGTYDIKNSYLIGEYNANTMKFVPEKSKSSGNDYLHNYMYENIQPIVEDHILPAMKQELLQGIGGKIVELDDNRLVLDGNGEQMIMQRVGF
ncbi:hypothetical protein Barb4_00968 [Bacteroidales bacterium Barb4]|nr:hypothetical protein Barb4_00968 [Bacteroidales bacterium Barb4]